MPGLPMMTTDEGAGSFTGHEFTVSGNAATMTLTPSRRVQASDLVFSIPDTTPRAIVEASAHAHMIGTADALADLVMREPLRRQAGLSIDPATVRGQAEGDLALDLKLGKAVRPDDTEFRATGALASLEIDKFLADEKLESATATFEADRHSLRIAGDGDLLGAPTHVEVGRAPGEEGSATVTFALDAAARAKRGLNFGSWLSGPLPVKLKAPLTRASAEVEIDLTPAGVDNPVPGVAKSAGKPGKATFLVKPAPEGALLSNIAVDLGGPIIRGSAEIGADGAMQSAKITQARIAPGDNFTVDVVNSPAEMKVSVRGATLDARAFIKSLMEGGAAAQSESKELNIDLRVASVIGANRQAIADLELTAFRNGGETRLRALRGRIGGGTVIANGAGGEVRLATNDAGALLRFADLYSRLEGGNLDLVVRPKGDSSAGEATVTNFLLRDEPAFRQLVAAGRPSTQEEGGAAIDASVARFQKMTAAFVRSPGKLSIQDAVIYNPLMGITTQGVIDFGHNELDVSGSFVPAYHVNTILTKIPLVGLILSGGEHEGVFGVSYRVHGPMSGPTLSVNPLSAMAPGILHRILAAIDGTTTRAGAPEPVNAGETPAQRSTR
jgi:hypothetical protein